MQSATPLPIIQIVADPSKANNTNPNGITIGTNMRPDKADFAVMMMMGEAIRVWAQLLIDKGNSLEHVIVYNPNIIHMKQTSEIRSIIRNIIKEASAMDMAMHKQPSIAPAMAAGRTVDQEGLVAFLRQQGLFGNEEDILSILEGVPSEKVLNDLSQYVEFNEVGSDPSQLSADTMLDYYLQWNHLNIDKNQVLAFSISER